MHTAAVGTSQHHRRVLNLTEQDRAGCHDALALFLIFTANGSGQSRILLMDHSRSMIVLESLDGRGGALRPHVVSRRQHGALPLHHARRRDVRGDEVAADGALLLADLDDGVKFSTQILLSGVVDLYLVVFRLLFILLLND